MGIQASGAGAVRSVQLDDGRIGASDRRRRAIRYGTVRTAYRVHSKAAGGSWLSRPSLKRAANVKYYCGGTRSQLRRHERVLDSEHFRVGHSGCNGARFD